MRKSVQRTLLAIKQPFQAVSILTDLRKSVQRDLEKAEYRS